MNEEEKKEILKSLNSLNENNKGKNGKKIWQSKTFWINVIGCSALILNNRYGINLAAEEQAILLAAINIILRIISKEKIIW